jgi:hypothetical protein
LLQTHPRALRSRGAHLLVARLRSNVPVRSKMIGCISFSR